MTDRAQGAGGAVARFARCAASMALIGAASGLTWPLFAVRLENEGYSASFIGASASLQAAAFILAYPLIARAHQWAGAVGLALAAAALAALCLLAIGLSGIAVWFVGRAGLGAGIGVLMVLCETRFMTSMPAARFGLFVGVFGFIWSLAFAAGPLILIMVGFEGWPPLVCLAALLVSGALILIGAADATAPAEGRDERWRLRAVAVLAPAALVLALCQGLVDSTHDTFIPLYGLAHGLDQSQAVSLLSILLFGIALAQIPVGALVDRLGHRKVIALMLAGILLSALLLAAALRHHWAMRLCVLALGMGAGGLWIATAALVKAETADAFVGAVNSGRTFCHGLGSFIGPLFAGAITDLWGASALPFAIAAIAAAGFAVLPLRPGAYPARADARAD